MKPRAESFGEGGGEEARGEPFGARDCCLGEGAMGTGTPGLALEPGVTVVGREVGRWHRLSRTQLGLLPSLGFPTPSHSTVLLPPPQKSLGSSTTLSALPCSTFRASVMLPKYSTGRRHP